MKKIFALILVYPFFVQAQSMGVKDIPVGEDTSIEIKKGKHFDKDFEIITNEDHIEGDAAPLLKDARANWKKACADWKSETKGVSKENQVLSITCGKMECSTVSMESTCHSTGKVTMKVKIRQ
ncbi:MAG: hypothetical protein ACXWQ7_14070 [Bdellovibrio sp.]